MQEDNSMSTIDSKQKKYAESIHKDLPISRNLLYTNF